MQKDVQIDSNQFATIATNLLNQGLLEAGRTTAKRIFRELEEGRTVGLTNLRMEDGGQVRFDLSLDAQAFNGALNYSAFRDGVVALVADLATALRAEKTLPTYKPVDGPESLPTEMVGSTLFGAGGLTEHEGVTNLLMLGVRPRDDQPIVTLQLMYLDPAQFATAAAS